MDQNYNNQQSFWQFSDQLRLQTAHLANLSTNDSIWSNSFVSKKSLDNFDVRVGAELGSSNNSSSKLPSDFNTFNNDGWNSFKTGGSDLLNVNTKLIGSGDKSKDPVNDYEMWNSFKLGTGSGLIGSSPNPKHLGPGSTNLNDQLNDFGSWNSFKSQIGSNFLNAKPNPIGSGTNQKDPVNEYGLWNNFKPKSATDYNGFNDGWKLNGGPTIPTKNQNPKEIGINTVGGNYSKGLSYKLGAPANNGNFNWKNNRGNGGEEAEQGGGKGGKKGNKGKNDAEKEKRFKTLPAAEALPRNERIGGYIFVCNNDTMAENLKRQLFGLPPRYRDSVRAITPGLPLFLYNYSTHQLHGVFEAASFGGTNIDSTAWEDKKCPGESRFPAQVKVIRRQICEPLEEDSFRPILHHYDGPKFRLELNIPEAISLLDVLYSQHS